MFVPDVDKVIKKIGSVVIVIILVIAIIWAIRSL